MIKLLLIAVLVVGIVGIAGFMLNRKTDENRKYDLVIDGGLHTFRFHPFMCGDKPLVIEQTFNEIPAATTVFQNITVKYGDAITFKAAHTFVEEIESKTGIKLTPSGGQLFSDFDRGIDYLAENHIKVDLPSQEELISRNIQPRPRGMVVLATTDDMSVDVLREFAECFAKNKNDIYSQQIKAVGSLRHMSHIWYTWAYSIRL